MRTPALLTVTALVTATVAAGCGGGGSSPTSPAVSQTPAPVATGPAAIAQIKTNWQTFFDSAGSANGASTAIGLLEDGDQLGGAITFASHLQKQEKLKEEAKVTKVTFTSPTQATVTYNLLNGTKPLLPNATGIAVLVNGKWLVSKNTFCGLVELGAGSKKVPGCSDG